jgi:hypothetical protein
VTSIDRHGDVDADRICVGTAGLRPWRVIRADPALALLRPDGSVFSAGDGAPEPGQP